MYLGNAWRHPVSLALQSLCFGLQHKSHLYHSQQQADSESEE
jgi:hypothetical protein